MRWSYVLIALLILAVGFWANWPTTEPLKLRLELVRIDETPRGGINAGTRAIEAHLRVVNLSAVEVRSWGCNLAGYNPAGEHVATAVVKGGSLRPGESVPVVAHFSEVGYLIQVERIELVNSAAIAQDSGQRQVDVISFVIRK